MSKNTKRPITGKARAPALTLLCLASSLFTLPSSVAVAAAGGNGSGGGTTYLRAGVVWVMPEGDGDVVDDAAGLLVQFGGQLEFVDLGFELGLVEFDAAAEFDTGGTSASDVFVDGKERMLPLLVTARWRAPLGDARRGVALSFGLSGGAVNDRITVTARDAEGDLIGSASANEWGLMWGAELALHVRPAGARWDFTAGYKYLRAEIDDFDFGGATIDGGGSGAGCLFAALGMRF